MSTSNSNFSGILQLTDLDDFIVPSQDCIKPIKIDSSSSFGTGSKIKIDGQTPSTTEVSATKLARVDISLDDCLACSGCITTAETVLISQQNHIDLLNFLEQNRSLRKDGKKAKFVVLTLSTQPIVSLANRFGLSIDEATTKLCGHFKQLGVNSVFSIGVADEISIQEMFDEFMVHYNENDRNSPLFTSACPGWVCYVEKTHNFLLPFISTTKSPQQIMGSIVKDYFSHAKKIPPQEIYHVTLMPCFDKKLEASRPDFFNEVISAKDVDCVLTPVEVEGLLQSGDVDLCDQIPEPLDRLHELDVFSNTLSGQIGSTSGGYAYGICRRVAKEFSIPLDKITFEANRSYDYRNCDIREYELKIGDRSVNFAIVNGFKNIQNIVQKMKRKKLKYDYVEIMACPSGCINGSAQSRPQKGITTKELVSLLEKNYEQLANSQDIFKPCGDHQNFIEYLYEAWLNGRQSDKSKTLLHTVYHAVPKNNFSIDIKW